MFWLGFAIGCIAGAFLAFAVLAAISRVLDS